jgi:hypothetical protein
VVHLEREWLEVLEPLGTKVFHATDFADRRPPYDRLGESECEIFLMSLIYIIRRRVERTISGAVNLEHHRAIDSRYVFSESYAFPYPLAARWCIGYVDRWAEKHSIVKDEIKVFLENGAKHKGQVGWIAERDGLPIPEFLEKKEVPVQVGDLLAWSQYLYLTAGGRNIPPLYIKALEALDSSSHEWGLINLSDPHRIPTILGIPPRDPDMNYKCRIIRYEGKRVATVRYWPKRHRTEPKVERKTLVLPEVFKRLSAEEVRGLAAEYDAKRRGGVP